jgi:DNA polymerase sigma
MLISFLQTREPPILPNLHETAHTLSKDNLVIHGLNSSFCCDNMEGFGSDNHETLGGLLYAFFRKFGYEFDYDHQVVSIRSKCLVSKRENWRDDRLCIEEPFDVHRNLGNSVDEASLKGLQLELQRAVNLILENNDLNTVCNLFQPPLHPHHNHYTSNNHSTSSIPINNTFAKKPPCYIYYADPTNYFPIYYLPNRPSKRHYNYKMKSGRDSKVKH